MATKKQLQEQLDKRNETISVIRKAVMEYAIREKEFLRQEALLNEKCYEIETIKEELVDALQRICELEEAIINQFIGRNK